MKCPECGTKMTYSGYGTSGRFYCPKCGHVESQTKAEKPSGSIVSNILRTLSKTRKGE